MRVTDSMQIGNLLRTNARMKTQLAARSRTAATGSKIAAPSDDPVAAARLARVQAQIDRTTAYRNTISSVKPDAELAESSLAVAQDIVKRANELALMGANDTVNAQSRIDIGKEVAELHKQLLAIANTKGNTGYLFAGTATTVAPFDAAGAWVGNINSRNAEVAPGVTVNFNINGANAFTVSGGRDILADFTALETALNTNNSAGIAAQVTNMDSAHKQLGTSRTEAGVLLARFETADSTHQLVEVAQARTRASIVDADPVQAYTEFNAAQTMLEQSMSVTRNILESLRNNKLT